jgi:hypothetical protein
MLFSMIYWSDFVLYGLFLLDNISKEEVKIPAFSKSLGFSLFGFIWNWYLPQGYV